MLTKGDIPKLLLAGMKTNFMKAYEGATKDYEQIATTVASTKSSETYPWLNLLKPDHVKFGYMLETPKDINAYYAKI